MSESKDEELEVFYFSERTDKLQAEHCSCPVCGVKYMMHVPYVNASCKKCGTRYQTDFQQDMYTKKARELNSWLAHKNEFKIKADEIYEKDVIHFRQHHIDMKCWDLSVISESKEAHYRCHSCGVCLHCFTCKSCGKTFEKDPNRRKVKCPHCSSGNFLPTYFKAVKTDDKNKLLKKCPVCHSERVVMTRTEQKTKCHLCGGKDLSDAITERKFWLTISRKKGYYI